jgi:O-antigen/teichoic acid export membrane protein
LGAIVLTALGMIYYPIITEWSSVVTDEGKLKDVHDQSLAQLTLLGFGGLLATALIFWFSSVMLKRLRQNSSVLIFRSHHLVRRG